MVSKNEHDVRRAELPFVRSLVRLLVRSSSWSKKMTMGCKKVMTRGRRSKNTGRAEKVLVANSGFEIWSVCKLPYAKSFLTLKRDEVKIMQGQRWLMQTFDHL
jgi:hypothetical protein